MSKRGVYATKIESHVSAQTKKAVIGQKMLLDKLVVRPSIIFCQLE
jgi:hypothetical protein